LIEVIEVIQSSIRMPQDASEEASGGGGEADVDLEKLLDVRDFVEEFLLVEHSFNEEDFRAFLLTYR